MRLPLHSSTHTRYAPGVFLRFLPSEKGFRCAPPFFWPGACPSVGRLRQHPHRRTQLGIAELIPLPCANLPEVGFAARGAPLALARRLRLWDHCRAPLASAPRASPRNRRSAGGQPGQAPAPTRVQPGTLTITRLPAGSVAGTRRRDLVQAQEVTASARLGRDRYRMPAAL